jgi:hypothetical protein
VTDHGPDYVTLAARLKHAISLTPISVKEASRQLARSRRTTWETEIRAIWRALEGKHGMKKTRSQVGRVQTWERLFAVDPGYFTTVAFDDPEEALETRLLGLLEARVEEWKEANANLTQLVGELTERVEALEGREGKRGKIREG